jgi:hypothetical protein
VPQQQKKIGKDGRLKIPKGAKTAKKVAFNRRNTITKTLKKKDLTPEEALMQAWEYIYENRHRRLR